MQEMIELQQAGLEYEETMKSLAQIQPPQQSSMFVEEK
jgi:hypothetical protein